MTTLNTTAFNIGDKVWVIDTDDENYHCGGDIIELGNTLGLPHDHEYRVAIELAESGEHWTEPTWYRAEQIQIAPGEKRMTTPNTTRVNWRGIDTTTAEGRRALAAEIARRLGWDVEHTPMSQDRLTREVIDALNLPVEHSARTILIEYPMAKDTDSRCQGIRIDTFSNEGNGWDASPALALCKAWLAWHDAAHPEGEAD